jgi:hypothetical protein
VLKWVTGHCNRAAVSSNRYGVEKTVDTHKILINAITFYVCHIHTYVLTYFYIHPWFSAERQLNNFLFGALLSHCNISLYWSIELLRFRIGVQDLLVLGSALYFWWIPPRMLIYLCDCGEEETTDHYILHCHIYDHERAKLAVQLKTIDESLDLLHLMTRDSNKEKHQNKYHQNQTIKPFRMKTG